MFTESATKTDCNRRLRRSGLSRGHPGRVELESRVTGSTGPAMPGPRALGVPTARSQTPIRKSPESQGLQPRRARSSPAAGALYRLPPSPAADGPVRGRGQGCPAASTPADRRRWQARGLPARGGGVPSQSALGRGLRPPGSPHHDAYPPPPPLSALQLRRARLHAGRGAVGRLRARHGLRRRVRRPLARVQRQVIPRAPTLATSSSTRTG